ncbi:MULTISPECIES: hypothetical protein [Asaia]|uniref:Uncharacterized protein n=2 Tax=Asaia bogorensis TaxID=91915 RepID=A0AAN4R1D1_9PROT|nr:MULTISPECIES: hypothetical protein [Asaia]ETC99053.1 hypothetical protein P792_06090 [Asaia sp. SF2.1]MDL2171153.1 hypothetical protein [Asaia sp. HumB]MDR6183580.1 hypothetical protein [Asaia bogorensis NBRC 16594]CDG40627.1 hypothetical protein ASAP_2582 [Asaia bogorensis]BAT18413.1 hypothetical protein Asbog_00096 [Asaia bogorensis NBRC 16594]
MAKPQKPRQDVPTINVRELIIMHIVLALFVVGIMLLDWHLN